MTDDGRAYAYEYDVFGRITRVTASGTSASVASFRHNGLNQRIAERFDADGDAALDDIEYHRVHDERWRVIAIYRVDLSGAAVRDAYAKEVTVYHAAGLDGRGGSSALDSVLTRYRSDDGAVSTTPEEEWALPATAEPTVRGVYFQTWRGDVAGFDALL